MRSIRMLAAVTGALVLGSACGGEGGTDPNTPPVANFTAPSCIAGTACTFVDNSTDDVAVTGWDWNFGDGTANAITEDAPHIFATANTYQVTLTVTDGAGLTGTRTNAVVVAPPTPGNIAPTASFNTSCDDAGNCTFTSTSADVAPGTITGYQWDFGDGTTATEQNPIHDYAPVAAPTNFTVTLIVTDNNGATGTASQMVTVSPPAAELCQTAGNLVTCTLDVAQRSTVKLTITEVLCELAGNKLDVDQPRRQTVFFNLCVRDVGEEYTVRDAAGVPLAIEAGTNLVLEFTQGTADPEDPPVGSPAVEIGGSYPNWTLSFDDGGNPTGPGEPDGNDVVISVQATLAP